MDDLHVTPAPDDLRITIHSRLGRLQGALVRLPFRFGGEPQKEPIDRCWCVCLDWPGPVVLVCRGCLEHLRFGLDPPENAFYYGAPVAGD